MIDTIAIIIALLAVLVYWKRVHQKLANQTFRYKMYELRDKLRNMAIEGKIDVNSKLFDYYDNSFSKTINVSYNITFPWLLLNSFVMNNIEKDEEYKEFIATLKAEIAENKELMELNTEYGRILTSYLIDQHYISIRIVQPFFKMIGFARIVRNKSKSIVTSALYMPQTSEVEKYIYHPINH